MLRKPTSCSVAPPVKLIVTVPARSLAALASSTSLAAPVSIVKLLLPPTLRPPDVCEMLPLAITVKSFAVVMVPS